MQNSRGRDSDATSAFEPAIALAENVINLVSGSAKEENRMITKAYSKNSSGKKTVISIDEALSIRDSTEFWCETCHERLIAHAAWRNGGSRAHFEHTAHSGGCRPRGTSK